MCGRVYPGYGADSWAAGRRRDGLDPYDWGGVGQESEKIKSTIHKDDSRLGRRRGAWFLEKGAAFNVAFEALIGQSRRLLGGDGNINLKKKKMRISSRSKSFLWDQRIIIWGTQI